MKTFEQLDEQLKGRKITQKEVKQHLHDAGHSKARWYRGGGDPGYDYEHRDGQHVIKYASYSPEHSHQALGEISKHLKSKGIEHTMSDEKKNDYSDKTHRVIRFGDRHK